MVPRIALITGGTRGIGRAIALRLARDGHVPVMVYQRDRAAAEEALALVQPLAPRALLKQADISDAGSVARLGAEVSAELGAVGILVNNAHRISHAAKRTHEIEPEEMMRALQANLHAHFLVTRALLPAMIAARFGRVVFLGSLAMRGEPGRASYAMVKNGLAGLMRAMAREYAKDGITANMVSPGFTEAGLFLEMSAEIKERSLKSVPMRRAASPEEVAAAVSYLCSEDAGYTTGQVLGVDGGA